MQSPSASYSLTVRLEITNKPGMLGQVTSAIGKAGGDIGAIDLVQVGKSTITRDLTFKARDEQHGQKIVREPKALLSRAGFDVRDVPEGHLCCGSAGTYNLLQPEIAGRLRDRKVANIESVAPAIVATGNIGCLTQIGSATSIPVVHTVELLDWATGGPKPAAILGAEFA